MRHIIYLVVLFLGISLFTNFTKAQSSPQQFKYQAVLRDASGHTLSSKDVTIEIDILKGSENGTVIFNEIYNLTTSNKGVVAFNIGSALNGTGLLSDIDWAVDSYFLRTKLDGNIMGTSPLLSVPYALHASSASTALTIDYNNITDAPDVLTWDTNASDDFDGNYNSLTNKPQTITSDESAKLTNITITAPVDLDQMNADVLSNNERLFPGFGTTEGLAIEGNTDLLWLLHSASGTDHSNIYYPSKVGINIPVDTHLSSAGLHVGGGISFEGIPEIDNTDISRNAGTLYYSAQDGGAFHYVNEELKNMVLGESAPSGPTLKDQVIEANTIIDGSLAVGLDAVNGEAFGFNTLVLKENNLRIFFDDTDTPESGMPYHDWKIQANESSNGGENHFAIINETTTNTPFKIMGGAPDNSFRIDENGNVGIGTTNNNHKLTVNGSIKAERFIGDGSGLTGITGGTGGISNTDDTSIEADTDNDNIGEISFNTNGVNHMVIANDGNIGIGTASPSAKLEVKGEALFDVLNVSGSVKAKSYSQKIHLLTTTDATTTIDVSNKAVIKITHGIELTINGIANGIEGQEITLVNAQGMDSNTDVIISHGGTGSQPIMLPGSQDTTINPNGTIRLICDGTAWYRL